MPQVTPQIILRADMVQPRRIPAILMTTFERLVNNVLQRLGFQITIEFFETGWRLFFCNREDFRCYFGSPIVPKCEINTGPPEQSVNVQACTVSWDYTFVRLPARPAEATFACIKERFYIDNGNLGVTAFEILPNP